MRISLRVLRRLIRETARDTIVAPTEPAEASPESMRSMSHPSLKSHDPVNVKADAVLKLLRGHGKAETSLQDVRKFISGIDPQRAFKLSADAIANAYLKRIRN